jgi:hypothetical protein
MPDTGKAPLLSPSAIAYSDTGTMSMSINRFLIKKWEFVCPFVRWLVVAAILSASIPASGQFIVRIDSHFKLEDFDRDGDGYKLTIRNDSEKAFGGFQVVILGSDISGVFVYRREFLVDFMEGKSERTFFVPGYDDRIFEVKMRILAPDYEVFLK